MGPGGLMKFFIDTADIKEVTAAMELGMVDGITTNPSLIAKSGRSYLPVIQEMAEICQGPISAEVLSMDYAGMMEEARQWVKVASNIVVKLPLTEEGLKACYSCAKEGISTNVTLCFSANQALLAAKAQATYISPFVGRLDDINQPGMDLIQEIKAIYDNYEMETEILVASIRSPLHVKEAALIGADVSTIPYKVIQQLIKHPLTDLGVAQFIEDGNKIPE